MKMLKIAGVALCLMQGVGAGRPVDPPRTVGIWRMTAPDYPFLPMRFGIEGDVHLAVSVDTDGNVTAVEATGAVDLLRNSAKENVSHWIFLPQPKPMKLYIVFSYRMEKEVPGKDQPYPPRVEVESPFHVIIRQNQSRLYIN